MSAKIFLTPEIKSGLGEDTFWTWFAREVGGEFDLPKKIGPTDVVLHYSTMGKPQFPNNTISLLWELYPEMALRLGKKYPPKMKKIQASFAARWGTCPTHYSRAFYSKNTTVLPIGVDTNLFKPALSKNELRAKHGYAPTDKIAFWSGQTHPMKGPELREKWALENPSWKLISRPRENVISQEELVEYMQMSDGFLNTSRLIPLYMVEWEALATGLPFIQAGGVEREFDPKSPREFVIENNWSRDQAKVLWQEFIDKCRFELTR
jgi:glycosyltransferase involved in cell wall biosynthesis